MHEDDIATHPLGLGPTRPPPRKLANGVYDLNWRRVKKPVAGVTDRNGRCPDCRKLGTGVNQGRENWMVCLECRTKWSIGHNLVTTHPEEWERLEDITRELENYREVESVSDFEDDIQRDSRVYSLVSGWIKPEGFLGERPVKRSLYQRIAAIVPFSVLEQEGLAVRVDLDDSVVGHVGPEGAA